MSSEVIGIDLGGTKTATAVLRDRRLSESLIQPTGLGSAASLIDQLAGMVDKVRSDDLAAVGIGVPSVVEFATGRVVSSINIPLANVPLREVLGHRVGVPVFVDNDATVAALAEAHDEQLSLVARNLVMFTLGTGVGGGIVLGGRIFRGATGGAGEFGHTVIGLDIDSSVPTPAGFPAPRVVRSACRGTGARPPQPGDRGAEPRFRARTPARRGQAGHRRRGRGRRPRR